MADLSYKFTGVNTPQFVNEVQLLRQPWKMRVRAVASSIVCLIASIVISCNSDALAQAEQKMVPAQMAPSKPPQQKLSSDDLTKRGIALRAELAKTFDGLASAGKLGFINDVTPSVKPYISAGMTFEDAESILRAAGFIVYPHPGAKEEQDRNRSRDWYAVLAEIPEFSRHFPESVTVYVTLYPHSPGDYGNLKDLRASIFVTIS